MHYVNTRSTYVLQNVTNRCENSFHNQTSVKIRERPKAPRGPDIEEANLLANGDSQKEDLTNQSSIRLQSTPCGS